MARRIAGLDGLAATARSNYVRWFDPTVGRWLSEDPAGLGPDANPYRYCGNAPTDGTEPSGLALKRASVDLGDGFRAGVDRGEELAATGGFEVHVYNSSGDEVAKINGRGGWAPAHGGDPLPFKPPEFKAQHPEVYRRLQCELESRIGVSSSWMATKFSTFRQSRRQVAGVLTVFAIGANSASAMDTVAKSRDFANVIRFIKQGRLRIAPIQRQTASI